MVPRNARPSPQRAQSANSTKRSTRSYSSSFEADDERSSSADHESMGPDITTLRDIPSQYAGEDRRLTSSKELSGWYAYGFAAEVFVICGMGKPEFISTSSCKGGTKKPALYWELRDLRAIIRNPSRVWREIGYIWIRLYGCFAFV